jgi:hypothetical protein
MVDSFGKLYADRVVFDQTNQLVRLRVKYGLCEGHDATYFNGFQMLTWVGYPWPALYSGTAIVNQQNFYVSKDAVGIMG